MPQYKTLTLQLIRQYPKVHYPLKEKRQLLQTVEREAKELSNRHKFWEKTLKGKMPKVDQIQTSQAALDLALKELENRLSGLPESLYQEQLLAAIIESIRTSPAE